MNQLTATERPIERVYTLPIAEPFRLVQSTLEYVLGLSLPQTRVIEQKQRTAIYHLWHGVPFAHIVLLDATAQTCLLRGHLLRPRDPVQAMLWRNAPEALHFLGMMNHLIELVDREIGVALRQVTDAETYAPPPPVSTPDDILAWRTLYHPDMPLRDVAEMTGYSAQSLYNARSQQYTQGAPRKVKRGRKPKN